MKLSKKIVFKKYTLQIKRTYLVVIKIQATRWIENGLLHTFIPRSHSGGILAHSFTPSTEGLDRSRWISVRDPVSKKKSRQYSTRTLFYLVPPGVIILNKNRNLKDTLPTQGHTSVRNGTQICGPLKLKTITQQSLKFNLNSNKLTDYNHLTCVTC